ncbi:type II secretion system protein [Crenobacter cavernae]|uniref:Prepilin-type N-terminal cleavage/methylation domain-containing protein n=1 Tax=Crenobacter cavernae TaxID=2290923 RepID=A0ABY0FB67_9NEIS|nr:prepilin-type N-terminal cleavage/methylation domain-containing protein [Crenobacter cavernae]RXZ43206.1 prepilin-type N-terminal cleavage/methylation domain-containing protein [Crenobacter cavernae]
MKTRGFTLIELLVVLSIVALMMALVGPRYFKQQDRAKETVLRHNLATLRGALDQYREDVGRDPADLDELVSKRYLKALPLDPILGKTDGWRIESGDDGRARDVRSGAPGKAIDGSSYGSW